MRPARFALTLLALLVVPFFGAGGAFAQTSLSFESVAALAVETAVGVRSAQLDLSSAERDLARVTADPTTLRVARLQTEHAVARARTSLHAAEAGARDATASAYTAALEADDQLAIAEAAREIAATSLEATQIRFDAGAATELDVERADNDLRSAERDVVDATATRTLAYDRLASLLALDAPIATLERAPEPDPVAPLDDYLSDLERNADLLAAEQGVELAEAQLAAVDNPLSSAPADVAAARDRLETARLQRDEQRRSLTLLARQAHNAALAAEARVRGAEAAASAARDDLAVQEVRFEAGSISSLALAQAEQQERRQAANLAAARHALATALRQVELTTLGAR
jgi:outer membrane protein